MASASSAAGKLIQSAQPSPRGATAMEKSKCRDENAILSFSAQKNGDRNGTGTTEIDHSRDSDQTIEALRTENEELRRLLSAAEEALIAVKEDDWKELEREYTRMLEEKTDVIRELHLKIQELQRAAGEEKQPSEPPPANADELCALSAELDHERKQLKEDEQSLMQQMRTMEIQMSRERAEIARQRADIERLHQCVRDELEQASRENTLRDRLVPLMRRHSEMIRNGSAVPPVRKKEAAPQAPESAPAENVAHSGLFRRIFGAGK